MNYVLVDENTNEVIPIGSERKTFRGQVVIVEHFAPPDRDGSTGRVYVKFKTGEDIRDFYPSVIGAKIIEKPEEY